MYLFTTAMPTFIKRHETTYFCNAYMVFFPIISPYQYSDCLLVTQIQTDAMVTFSELTSVKPVLVNETVLDIQWLICTAMLSELCGRQGNRIA